MIERFEQPAGLFPIAGVSHATAATGRLVVISGQLPVDAGGAIVGDDDGPAQARQVFANIAAALRAAGATPADVIRLGYFLTDLADLAAVRSARDEFLGGAAPPASTLVQVAGLIAPGARMEIDALAVV